MASSCFIQNWRREYKKVSGDIRDLKVRKYNFSRWVSNLTERSWLGPNIRAELVQINFLLGIYKAHAAALLSLRKTKNDVGAGNVSDSPAQISYDVEKHVS